MTFLLNLYPRAWRERYEDEFLALLEARPPGAHDRLDIVRGAIDARLHPNADRGGSLEPPVPLPYNGPWTARRTGFVTFLGGVLFVLGVLLAVNGPLVPDGDRTYREGSSAWAPFFGAVILLLLGLWAVAATLPRDSRVARAAAVIAAICGMLWAAAPWMVYFGIVLLLCTATVVIEAARTRRWRLSDAAIVVGAILAAISVPFLVLSGTLAAESWPVAEPDIQFVMFLCLAPIWFAIAHALVRPAIPIADPVRETSAA
jgi:hypothetical protein